MNDDNIGNFFDADDFGEAEENEESWKPIKVYGNELFKKAIDILNLTESLCDVLPDDDHSVGTKQLMLQNAMVIPAKLKGAMAIDEIYSVVMESAVIIKINMVQLKDLLFTCSAIHNVDEKYVDVLRNEINEFRKVFVLWVACFDKENDYPDEWHLFNNPV